MNMKKLFFIALLTLGCPQAFADSVAVKPIMFTLTMRTEYSITLSTRPREGFGKYDFAYEDIYHSGKLSLMLLPNSTVIYDFVPDQYFRPSCTLELTAKDRTVTAKNLPAPDSTYNCVLSGDPNNETLTLSLYKK